LGPDYILTLLLKKPEKLTQKNTEKHIQKILKKLSKILLSVFFFYNINRRSSQPIVANGTLVADQYLEMFAARTFNLTRNTATRGFKVAVVGASGGIGNV
jgi:hypothetical protein